MFGNVAAAGWGSSRIALRRSRSGGVVACSLGTAPPDHLDLIPVTEALAIDGHRANFTYRVIFDPLQFGYQIADANPTNWRASASYVTGSHNAKFGFTFQHQESRTTQDISNNGTLLTLLNGAPRSVTVWATPLLLKEINKANVGIYAQDQWRVKRLTMNYGVRLDMLKAAVDEQVIESGPFTHASSTPRMSTSAAISTRSSARTATAIPAKRWTCDHGMGGFGSSVVVNRRSRGPPSTTPSEWLR